MKNNIEKIKDDLYVKRSMGEWIVVHPVKKDLDKPFGKGNINWKNFLIGSWGSFLTIVIFLVIIGFLIWSYREDMNTCVNELKSPCVQQCQSTGLKLPISNFSIEVMNNEWKNNERLPRE